MEPQGFEILEKIPMITPVVKVLQEHLLGDGKLSKFNDEVTIEGMSFRIKTVPYRDIHDIYTEFSMDKLFESVRNIITQRCENIHTRYEIYEQGQWNQCMEANLDKFKNPVNILYLKHHYFAKCLFLYLTCGR